METLEGTAAAEFFELRMHVAGKTHVARSESPAGILLEDGSRVGLDLRRAVVVPNVDEEDELGRLLERGVATPFLDRAPGDHVKVRISGVRVEEGTPVCVSGEVERAARADGYRDGSTSVPTRVQVAFLAAGDDARAQVERARREAPPSAAPREQRAGRRGRRRRERRDERPTLWPALLFLTPGLALALAAPALATSAHSSALAVPAIFLSSVGVYFAARRRFLPDLRTAQEDAGGSGKRTWIGMWHAVPLFIVGFFLFAGAGMTARGLSAQGVSVVLALAAAVPLALATSLAIAQRRAFVRLVRVARARASTGPGRFGALEGRVVAGSVNRTRTHTLERDDYRDLEGRSHSRSRWTFVDRLHANTLEIALEGGGSLVVHPSGGVFAAEASSVRGEKLVEEIRPGDRVRVVGRPTGDAGALEVRSTGPESLFVLGSRQRSARGAAVRALALHGLAVLALLGIALTAAGQALLATRASLDAAPRSVLIRSDQEEVAG